MLDERLQYRPMKRKRYAISRIQVPVAGPDDVLKDALAKMHSAERSALLCVGPTGHRLFTLHDISTAIAKNPNRTLGQIKPGRRVSTNMLQANQSIRRGRNALAIAGIELNLARIAGRRDALLPYASPVRYFCDFNNHPSYGPNGRKCERGDGGTIYAA